jgi:hypothetical protein
VSPKCHQILEKSAIFKGFFEIFQNGKTGKKAQKSNTLFGFYFCGISTASHRHKHENRSKKWRWLRNGTRHLFYWLHLRLLKSLPLHEIDVHNPVAIHVYLLVDAGGPMYEQVEWKLSASTHLWLKNAKRIHMAIDIREGGDTEKSFSAHANLIPDRHRNPLQNNPASQSECATPPDHCQ